MTAPSIPTEQSPFPAIARRAALLLVLLAPFFYSTYGFANWAASQREHVGSIVYDWERSIPFLAWTILPYWTINAFYALSLFVNRTISGVNRLAGRYFISQLIAVVCFLAFPLATSFTRPETSGLPGFMFDVLGGFDKPFNQAPSLHIALTVIIWDHLRRRLTGPIGFAWDGWCLLIAVSVLTTYQHHFIDIPTGALLGLFVLWLVPAEGPLPLSSFAFTADPKRRRIGSYYAVGAALCLAGAVAFAAGDAPSGLILLWPALALAIVSLGYFGAGAKIFQKHSDGDVSLASRWLLWPYRVGARLNAWAWTRKLPPAVEIADGVWLGRFPRGAERETYGSVIDLAAEFEGAPASGRSWASIPMLDLVMPRQPDIDAAAAAIEQARMSAKPGERILVCCALGFQRSARAVAGWLLATGRAPDQAAAVAMLMASGRRIVLHDPVSATAPA